MAEGAWLYWLVFGGLAVVGWIGSVVIWWLFGSEATEDGSDRSSTPDYHVWGR